MKHLPPRCSVCRLNGSGAHLGFFDLLAVKGVPKLGMGKAYRKSAVQYTFSLLPPFFFCLRRCISLAIQVLVFTTGGLY